MKVRNLHKHIFAGLKFTKSHTTILDTAYSKTMNKK